MADDNVPAVHTGRPGGLDELFALDGQGLPAHDPRHGQPFDGTDSGEDEHDVALEHGQQQDHKEDERQGVEYVHDPHHEIVDASAEIAGGGPPADTNDETDGGCHDADHQRDAQADHETCQQVSALQVCSQRVHAVKGGGNHAQVRNRAIIMHPDHGPEDGDNHQHAKDPHGNHGRAVTQQACAGVFPEGASADDGFFNWLDTARRVEKGIHVCHQSYFTFGSSIA